MSNIITQYPDLTEVKYSYSIDKDSLGLIKTEFAFYLSACGTVQTMEDLGFKCVSAMNNWWPSHAGETRTMRLYWLKVPHSDCTPQVANRFRWCPNEIWENLEDTNKYKNIFRHLAGSGCAFKIGEPPFKVSLFHRFFTLMRMPLIVTPLQKRWLTKYNYRPLEKGKLAGYWINGWPPEEYSVAKEFEYFKTTKLEWGKHGEDGYPPFF